MDRKTQGTPNPEERVLRRYFEEIAESKPLSREREVEFASRIRQGDVQARDDLVQANLRFAVVVARRYQHRGLPLSDLISAANLGLLTAAERFDGTKGTKFISYAVWWIRQAILQNIAEHARTVRLPHNKLGLLNDIAKASRRLSQGCEGEPDIGELAVELDVSPDEILRTMQSALTMRSLDEAFEEDDERNLLDTLADTSQAAPDTEILRDSDRKQLVSVLNSLDERESRVIRLYFGLDDHEALNLDKIGCLLHITRERVRQLKERALNKLRHPTQASALLALMPGSTR